MSVLEWAKKKHGRITWLAGRLGVTRQYMQQMLRGDRPVSAARAAAIKRAMKERERAERILG